MICVVLWVFVCELLISKHTSTWQISEVTLNVEHKYSRNDALYACLKMQDMHTMDFLWHEYHETHHEICIYMKLSCFAIWNCHDWLYESVMICYMKPSMFYYMKLSWLALWKCHDLLYETFHVLLYETVMICYMKHSCFAMWKCHDLLYETSCFAIWNCHETLMSWDSAKFWFSFTTVIVFFEELIYIQFLSLLPPWRSGRQRFRPNDTFVRCHERVRLVWHVAQKAVLRLGLRLRLRLVNTATQPCVRGVSSFVMIRQNVLAVCLSVCLSILCSVIDIIFVLIFRVCLSGTYTYFKEADASIKLLFINYKTCYSAADRSQRHEWHDRISAKAGPLE